MRHHSIIGIIFLFTLMHNYILLGQEVFHGNFLMSFSSSTEKIMDSPMLWNIESINNGGRMALQIQDELLDKGVSKRVIFNPADSTWTMLLSLNSIKQGSRVKRGEMYRQSKSGNKILIKADHAKRIIAGYKCKKYTFESSKYKAEVWVTNEIKFDLGHIYKLLAHCGMVSDIMRKGDWFLSGFSNGMILEVTSHKIETDESYTMHISDIHKSDVNEKMFDITGFKISEIPEGQNCGVIIDDK